MGPYNQTNHETREISGRAAAELMEGVSCFFMMLASLERRDYARFAVSKKETIDHCDVSADLFRYTSELLSDEYYVTPAGSEAAHLVDQLRAFGHVVPFNNRSLGTLSAEEIERFKNAVKEVDFREEGGPPIDWQTFRGAIDAEARLLHAGLVLSKLASLNLARTSTPEGAALAAPRRAPAGAEPRRSSTTRGSGPT
jgi:hypothetical protein